MIDDNPTDVLLMRRALAAVGMPHDLNVAQDGEEGLRVLLSTDAGSELPDLILLDLNMPKKDGFQVLAEIRAQPVVGRIPVVVFTSSTYRGDVDRCYDLHANSYIAKPLEYDTLKNLVLAISQYWFTLNMLPG